jgi:hypothetical protein
MVKRKKFKREVIQEFSFKNKSYKLGDTFTSMHINTIKYLTNKKIIK